jgi:hypothetical protein
MVERKDILWVFSMVVMLVDTMALQKDLKQVVYLVQKSAEKSDQLMVAASVVLWVS